MLTLGQASAYIISQQLHFRDEKTEAQTQYEDSLWVRLEPELGTSTKNKRVSLYLFFFFLVFLETDIASLFMSGMKFPSWHKFVFRKWIKALIKYYIYVFNELDYYGKNHGGDKWIKFGKQHFCIRNCEWRHPERSLKPWRGSVIAHKLQGRG